MWLSEAGGVRMICRKVFSCQDGVLVCLHGTFVVPIQLVPSVFLPMAAELMVKIAALGLDRTGIELCLQAPQSR